MILCLTGSAFNLGGGTAAREGGCKRPVKESASDNTRTRAGGAGGPALKGGLRAGGGGIALAIEDGPALEGLGGGGGGGGLPGIVGASLMGALAGCKLLRDGIVGATFVTTGGAVRSGETLRCGRAGDGREGTAGDGRNGTAGDGRAGDAGGLELRRGGGGRRGEAGALVGGAGATRAERLGAGRVAGKICGGACGGNTGGCEEGFGGGALVVSVSRLGIEGGFPKLGGFATEKDLVTRQQHTGDAHQDCSAQQALALVFPQQIIPLAEEAHQFEAHHPQHLSHHEKMAHHWKVLNLQWVHFCH